MIILAIGIFLALLLAGNEIARRYPSIAILLFIIGPILILPWGIYQGVTDWFLWAKAYSIFVGIGVILALRFTHLNQIHYSTYLLWLMVGLNILEAAVEGITQANSSTVGYLLPTINAFVGVILIMTIPSTSLIKVDDTSSKDLLWTIPMGWIISYTIWNAAFIYMTFPESALRQLPLLVAPLILEFWRRGLWLQTRVFTLGIFLLIRFIYEPAFDYFVIPSFYNHYAAFLLTMAGVVCVSGYLFWYLYQHRLPIREFIVYEWSQIKEI